MKMKRTVALTLSALLMLTLLFALPVLPARAGSTEVFTLAMGNNSRPLYLSRFTETVYIDTSFSASTSQTSDSFCMYDPHTPNRLTLIRSATITGFIIASDGDLDIHIENGVTLTLNAINNGSDPTECVGIRMRGGALSFSGTSGNDTNNGKLVINNAAASLQGTHKVNAAIYAEYCPRISLSGGCTVEVTGGLIPAAEDGSQSFSYGVYLNNTSDAAALSLTEGSKLIAAAGEMPAGESRGVDVYSQQNASIRVSDGSQLTGTGRASLLGSRGVSLISGGNTHMLVEGTGSKLTGASSSAPSGNSYAVCIENFSASPALLQIRNGSEVTGTSGAGYTSHGVYVRSGADGTGLLVERGGALTGTGGDLGADSADGWSFGVYCNKDISVSGQLTGTGGDSTRKIAGSYAKSCGVYSGSSAIIVDGGTVTGNSGATTAQGATAEGYGISAGSITLTGTQAVLKGFNQKACIAETDSYKNIAGSYGVYSTGAITVGNTCTLVGTAGNASSKTNSFSYGVYSDGIITASGSLTGVGKNAAESCGVYAKGQNISVSGSLSGTSEASGGSADASYGVNAGKGKITISGTVNAAANTIATRLNNCIGIRASGGIALTGNGRLIAKAASAAPDERHCAKAPKDALSANALTAGADAAWRGGDTAAFEALAATYNDSVPRAYLEVQNNQPFKVTPTSASINAGQEVTLIAQGAAGANEINWCVSGTQAYDGASALTGKTGSTLTLTPGSDHQTKYYFAKIVLNDVTFYSNLVPVTAKTHGIALTPANDYRFPDGTFGYADAPQARAVTIANTGNAPTGSIAVTLSGAHADSFIVQSASFADILAGANAGFTIQPKTNLGAGTYTATVTVGPAQGNANPLDAQRFAVSFTVLPAPLLNVEITPRDSFVKGDAPALTIIVGHGLPELTVNNLSGVTVTMDGVRTALTLYTHYDASTGGSIHIAPKTSWLNTLNPGDYPVDIALRGGAYEGMHVYTRFTVTAPLPPTGDSASPALWLCLLAGALLTLGAVRRTRRAAKAKESNG